MMVNNACDNFILICRDVELIGLGNPYIFLKLKGILNNSPDRYHRIDILKIF